MAVTSTSVLPRRATTAPWLWNASLPVSKVSVVSVPETGADTTMGSAIVSLLPGGIVRRIGRRGQFPVGSRDAGRSRAVEGDWQLTFTLPVILLSYDEAAPEGRFTW